MQQRRICRGNSKYAPDESFVAIFALAERLPTSATLLHAKIMILIDDFLLFSLFSFKNRILFGSLSSVPEKQLKVKLFI